MINKAFIFLLLVGLLSTFSTCDDKTPPKACFKTQGIIDGVVKSYDPILFTSCSTDGRFLVWHFGDGTTSGETEVSHTYTIPGTYKVVLVASNDAAVDSSKMTIQVDTNFEITAEDFEFELVRGDSQVFNCSPKIPIQFRIIDNYHGDVFTPEWLKSKIKKNEVHLDFEDWQFNIFSRIGENEFLEKTKSPPSIECDKCYQFSWHVANCENLTSYFKIELFITFKGKNIVNSPYTFTGFLPG